MRSYARRDNDRDHNLENGMTPGGRMGERGRPNRHRRNRRDDKIAMGGQATAPFTGGKARISPPPLIAMSGARGDARKEMRYASCLFRSFCLILALRENLIWKELKIEP